MTTTRFSSATLVLALAAAAVGCKQDLSERDVPTAILPALVVEEVAPAAGASEVPRDAVIAIRLSATIDRSSLGAGLEGLADILVVERVEPPARVDGTYALEEADTRLTFTPAAPLDVPEVRYRITVAPGLRNLAGQELDVAGSPVPLPSEFTTETIDDRVPPVFAGITTLEVVSSTALRAGWEPADDDVSSADRIVYRVYRNDPPDTPAVDYSTPVLETPPGSLDALLTGLAPDTEYTIGVRAADPFGNESDNLETISARTLPVIDVTPPVFAGLRELDAPGPRSLLARWDAAIDDVDASADIRYRVYLASGGPIDFQSPALVTPAGVTEATIRDLEADTLYTVAVRAADTADNEDDNDVEISVRTLVSFADNVFPIFSTPSIGGCIRSFCHDSRTRAGKISFETYSDILAGGRTVDPPAVVPGDAGGSLIIWRIDESSPDFKPPRMPLGRPGLGTEHIAVIRRWIDQGALDN